MHKSQWIVLFGLAAVMTFAAGSLFAGKDCARTEFKTELTKKACQKGGQKEAKKAHRKFMKKAKKATKEKITCRTCHTKTSGKYPLKKNGLELYNKYKKAM